jgi:hypothetical protein
MPEPAPVMTATLLLNLILWSSVWSGLSDGAETFCSTRRRSNWALSASVGRGLEHFVSVLPTG